MSVFKTLHTFEQRLATSTQILAKYPDKIPVIVERAPNNTSIPDIDKHKYLVPADITVGQFLFVIRKRIKLAPEQALFLFVNNHLPSTSALMSTVYKEERESDLFLYFALSGESVYGTISVGRN